MAEYCYQAVPVSNAAVKTTDDIDAAIADLYQGSIESASLNSNASNENHGLSGCETGVEGALPDEHNTKTQDSHSALSLNQGSIEPASLNSNANTENDATYVSVSESESMEDEDDTSCENGKRSVKMTSSNVASVASDDNNSLVVDQSRDVGFNGNQSANKMRNAPPAKGQKRKQQATVPGLTKRRNRKNEDFYGFLPNTWLDLYQRMMWPYMPILLYLWFIHTVRFVEDNQCTQSDQSSKNASEGDRFKQLLERTECQLKAFIADPKKHAAIISDAKLYGTYLREKGTSEENGSIYFKWGSRLKYKNVLVSEDQLRKYIIKTPAGYSVKNDLRGFCSVDHKPSLKDHVKEALQLSRKVTLALDKYSSEKETQLAGYLNRVIKECVSTEIERYETGMNSVPVHDRRSMQNDFDKLCKDTAEFLAKSLTSN